MIRVATKTFLTVGSLLAIFSVTTISFPFVLIGLFCAWGAINAIAAILADRQRKADGVLE